MMYGATLGNFILSHEEIEKAFEKRSRDLRDEISKTFFELDNDMLLNLKLGKAVLISLSNEKTWSDFLRVIVTANGYGEKIVVKQIKGDDLVKPGTLYVCAKKPDVDWEVVYHDFFLSSMDNLLTTMKVSTRGFKDSPKKSTRQLFAAAAMAY